MKVLQWGPLPSGTEKGGVEFYVKRLSQSLSDAGHDVTICNFGFGDESGGIGKKFVPVGEYDIIHVHMGLKSFGVLSLLRKLFSETKIVFTVHIVPNVNEENVGLSKQYLKHLFGFEFNKLLAKYSDGVTAVSSYSQNRCLEDYKVNPVVIPNAVETDRFRPIDEKKARNKVQDWKKTDLCDGPIILYLGALKNSKGVDMLIESYEEVSKENLGSQLIIAGGGEDEKKLEETADNSDYNGEITFLGIVPDEIVPYLYNIADVFCMPTRGMEGMPTTVLESMATQTPVVSTSVGGLNNIIEDGKTGRLVSPTTESITTGLNELLQDPKLRHLLAMNAFDYVQENHQWSEVASDYIDFYNSVI